MKNFVSGFVYIAGPYAAEPGKDHDHKVHQNVRRAEQLGTHATQCGFVPLVVHGDIRAGVYGDDSNPEERKRGRACSMALLELVAYAVPGNGYLWVIARDDGSLSPGTQAEVDNWDRLQSGENLEIRNWADWLSLIEQGQADD